MRIRKLSLALGAAVFVTAGAFITPAATAAEVSISGDECTVQLTASEQRAFYAQLEKASDIILTELKKALPTVADDLDAALLGLSNEESYARIALAASEAGFEESEVTNLMLTVIVFKDYESFAEEGFFDSFLIAGEKSFTQADAARWIVENPTEWQEEYDGSAAAKAIEEKAYAVLIPLVISQKELYQACVDGKPGSYNLSLTGGGNGGGQAGGNNGSSGSSFGSS